MFSAVGSGWWKQQQIVSHNRWLIQPRGSTLVIGIDAADRHRRPVGGAVVEEEVAAMTAVNCPMCELRFAARTERDWHLRNEHQQVHVHGPTNRPVAWTGHPAPGSAPAPEPEPEPGPEEEQR